MGQKLKFVLSDLYIGAGISTGGNHGADFVADDQFIEFLHEIEQESERYRRELELIINGNFLEFLCVPAVDHIEPGQTFPKEAFLNTSEEASLKRLHLIRQQHSKIFDVLSNFMHAGVPKRRITIIKGNHDVHLFWPRVKSRLRRMLRATGSRASLLLFAEEFVSREKIYVEHGHQRAEAINRYADFLDPRHPQDPSQLYYPAGSRLIIDLFNEPEARYFFANSIKPVTTLFWCTLQWNLILAADILNNLVQNSLVIGTNGAGPTRMTSSPSTNLLQYLSHREATYQTLQRCADDAVFRQEFYSQIQQYFFDNGQADSNTGRLSSCPNAPSDPLSMGRAAQKNQRALLRQAAEEIAQREGAAVVLFGHTHHPTQVPLKNGGLYINTGCWLNDYSDASDETWQALFSRVQTYNPLPSRLPYVRIDFHEADNPTARLLDFAGSPLREKIKILSLPDRIRGWVTNLFGEPPG